MQGRRDTPARQFNEQFESLRSDWQINQQSRFQRRRKGVSATGRSADWHFRSESQWLYGIEVARDIDSNDIAVGQGVTRLVDNVVQEGFTLDPDVGDSTVDDALEARWKDYAADPEQVDLAGEKDWHDIEVLTLRNAIVDGDVIHLPMDNGTLESCEAHRCRTPHRTKRNVVLGVLLDEVTRQHLEYWMVPDDLGFSSKILVNQTRPYKTRQYDPLTGKDERALFHFYLPRRFSQTRGVTSFSPFAIMTEYHDDIQFAHLVKAKIAASYAILEEYPAAVPGVSSRPGKSASTGATETERLADGSTRTVEGLGPGMRHRGAPGAKLTGFSANVPNTEFFQHSMLMLSLISVNLGLPVQLLMLDPKQTNFSGWRGAIDQARLGFRKFQRQLIARLHSPVYRWKVREWMAEDTALRRFYEREGEQIFRHKWNPPRWPYIQPMDDAAAGILRVRNFQTSQRRLAAENGANWWELVDENLEDNAGVIDQAIKRANALRAKYPDENITWRDLLCLPTPDRVGGQVSLNPQPQQQGAPDGDE